MPSNHRGNLAESLLSGFEERVIASPVWGPMLVISCAVAANVLVRLPATPAGSVPRLLATAVAVAVGMSALHALLYVLMSRLVGRRRERQMDKNEFEFRRDYRLLDQSSLNPHRHLF